MITATKTPQAITITLYSLGIFLGLIHIFFGVIALSPAVSQDYHREMKRNYYAFAKSLSLLHVYVDLPILALYLRYFLSSCQAVFGVLLLENGHFGPIGKLGNVGLIAVDIIYLLLQLRVETSYQKIAPTLVFSLLLVTRLYFALQNSKKMKPGVKTRNTGKPKTSTPKKNKNE